MTNEKTTKKSMNNQSNWFNDRPMSFKIFSSSILMLLLLITVTVFSMVQIKTVTNTYDMGIGNTLNRLGSSSDAAGYFIIQRLHLQTSLSHALEDDLETSKELMDIAKTYEPYIYENLATYRQHMSPMELDSIDFYNGLVSDLDTYFIKMDEYIAHIENGQIAEGSLLLQEELSFSNDNLTAKIFELEKIATTFAKLRIGEVSENGTKSFYTIGIICVIAAIISITSSFLLTGNILTPINSLMNTSKNIAKGNLNAPIEVKIKNEIGDLANSIGDVVNTFNSLQSEILIFHEETIQKGNLKYLIPEDNFHGDFKTLVASINFAYADIAGDLYSASKLLNKYSAGDFTLSAPKLAGDKEVITSSINQLRDNLLHFNDDLNQVIVAGQQGDLTVSFEVSGYEGTWRELAEGVNTLLDAFITPIDEVVEVLAEIEQGKLSRRVTSPYLGTFNDIKISLNQTMAVLEKYIQSISYYLNEMTSGNLDLQVDEAFSGDFEPIQMALKSIVQTFNTIMTDINASAEQVAAGSRQISQSSMALAQGATEQATSVDQLTSTVDAIHTQTMTNAQNAVKANQLAVDAKVNATKGNGEMKDMLTAMKEIDNASADISHVIKVIDEIAFQTNLLALNAAVEAAHAGQHGRGFSVVAEQVRTLAARSQEAARETTELIVTSIEKVAHGTNIANNTAATLEHIVSQVSDISHLISGVAMASEEQADAIDLMVDGIDQIARVTQANTATSEEEAASSEELSSQAEILNDMVSTFKLQGGSTQSLNIDLSKLNNQKHAAHYIDDFSTNGRDIFGYSDHVENMVDLPGPVRKTDPGNIHATDFGKY